MTYRGSCQDMCPESERQTRFGLYMSIFEKDENNQPDERAMVKEYRRSGADQEEPSPEDLRTPQALKLTMDYLVCKILNDSRSKTPELALEWYDFLWDRLRAIRKDITQQNICDQESALLVERCARFHVHCCYAMNRVNNFDVEMNKRNLNDCLQMLRQMYGDLKTMGFRCSGELEFQKYDILLHLNEDHLSSTVLMKTSDYRETKEMKFITQIFNAYTNNQFHKFFQLMTNSDYMTACVLSLYANKMRLLGLKTIINACAPRQTTLYPAQLLIQILGFDDLDDLKSFVSTMDLEIQKMDDGSCFLVLNRDIMRTLRQKECIIQPYKSRRLVEDKTSGEPIGLLVDGRKELPHITSIPMSTPITIFEDEDMNSEAEEMISEEEEMNSEGEEMNSEEEEEVEVEQEEQEWQEEEEEQGGQEEEEKEEEQDEQEKQDEQDDGNRSIPSIDYHEMEVGDEPVAEIKTPATTPPQDREVIVTMESCSQVEDEGPFEHALRVRDKYTRDAIADMMPAGRYKVRPLTSRLPKLNSSLSTTNRTQKSHNELKNVSHRRLVSLASSIDDEARANEMFSHLIHELENIISS